MANERDDKLEGQDEGEYHFSDDQMNYEMEDVPAPEDSKSTGGKGDVLGKMGSYRRYVIGGAGFIVLLFIVYKMMVPATVSPSTEITQVTPTTAGKAAPPVMAVSPPQAGKVAAQPVQPPQVVMQAPAATAVPNPMAMPPQIPPPSAPVAVPAGQVVIQQTTSLPPQMPQPQTAQGQQFSPSMPPSSAMPSPVTGPSSLPTGPVDAKAVMDKLVMLEQQNSKLAYTIDTEYAQKLSSYETQNSSMQTKLQDLSTRITNIEAGLTQLTQLLQGQKQPQPPPPTLSQKQAEPKIIYTVQAIIPGRAWLKSDAGDTVTVAEGDVLKNFGKVIKLDPYDGVVEVDTGIKVITLTYGGGSTT